jgi:hypothetical protein
VSLATYAQQACPLIAATTKLIEDEGQGWVSSRRNDQVNRGTGPEKFALGFQTERFLTRITTEDHSPDDALSAGAIVHRWFRHLFVGRVSLEPDSPVGKTVDDSVPLK